jgi:PHD/YefM family antitoxin component YafN of YafNO toxin-antitoxin module
MIPTTYTGRGSTCTYGMFGNDGNDYSDNRRRLTKPLIMATSVLVVGRRSLTAGMGAAILVLAYWAWKSKGHANDDDEAVQNQTVSENKATAWVSNRLNDIQLQEDEKDERLREIDRARQAKVMENARKWAASTLETTEDLQQQAQERRIREAEEAKRARMWVENVARESGIDLGGVDENDDDYFEE